MTVLAHLIFGGDPIKILATGSSSYCKRANTGMIFGTRGPRWDCTPCAYLLNYPDSAGQSGIPGALLLPWAVGGNSQESRANALDFQVSAAYTTLCAPSVHAYN